MPIRGESGEKGEVLSEVALDNVPRVRGTKAPSIEEVWQILASIPDPEIPIITIMDLGIVRGVNWQGDRLVVTVTPTYSGCPATGLISELIKQTLLQHGIANLMIKQQLSPAWTTDWLAPAAHQALKDYGIVPPSRTDKRANQANSACPYCQSSNTEKLSQFGSTPCKASYRCLSCLEPFELFKCH